MSLSAFGRHAVLGMLVVTACSAAACSAEYEGAPGTLDGAMTEESEQERLRKVILAADAPAPPAEQPPTQTGEETEIKTENGVAHDCSYKRYTGTALYETLASFDPNADTIWPGAVIQTKDLPQGLAAPIGLPRREGSRAARRTPRPSATTRSRSPSATPSRRSSERLDSPPCPDGGARSRCSTRSSPGGRSGRTRRIPGGPAARDATAAAAASRTSRA